MTYHRILVPTDFSPGADLALSHALFHAETYSSELHMVHCVTWVGQQQFPE